MEAGLIDSNSALLPNVTSLVGRRSPLVSSTQLGHTFCSKRSLGAVCPPTGKDTEKAKASVHAALS